MQIRASDSTPFRPASPVQAASDTPRRRYAKQIIKVGEYIQDATGQSFTVDGDLLLHWADTFDEMKANGLKVPVPDGHKSDVDAGDNRGFVQSMWLEDDALVAEIELIGQDAIDSAARSDVSIFSPPVHVDGKGRKYERPILHVALTATPLIPGLAEFIPLAASRGFRMNELIEKIAAALGLEDVPSDDIDKATEMLVASIEGMKQQPEDDDKTEDTETLDTIPDDETENSDETHKGNGVPVMASQFAAAKIENRTLKIDGLLRDGRISKAQADILKKDFIGKDGAVIRASMEAGEEINDKHFDSVLTVLASNKKLTEQISGAQVIDLDDPAKGKDESPLVANAKKRAQEHADRVKTLRGQ